MLRQLREWIDGGVRPDDITVLSPEASRILRSRDRPGRLPRPIVDISHAESDRLDKIRFSTVAGFKGLESEAVLLTGFDDLKDLSTLSLLYVGASRARALLGLVLDERCREAYVERAQDVVERLVGVAGLTSFSLPRAN